MPETLHLDQELAAKAEALFQELGLDLNTAVRLFLLQSLREHGLPFTPRLTAPLPSHEKKTPPPMPPEEKASAVQEAKTSAGDEAPFFSDGAPFPTGNASPLSEKAEEEPAQEEPSSSGKTASPDESNETREAGIEESVVPAEEGQEAAFTPGGNEELRRAFARAHLIGAPLRRVRSLNRLYAIGEKNPHVQGWREVYVSGDEPFALDFGAVRVELGFHGGGSLRMMDGRLPDKVLEADAVYPRDLSAVFSSVIGQPLTDVSSSRVWNDGQEREQLRLQFANGCTLTFAPGGDWGALWLSDAHGSIMFAPDAVWLRVLDDRAMNGLR